MSREEPSKRTLSADGSKTLRRDERVKTTREFLHAKKHGRRIDAQAFILQVLQRRDSRARCSRLGLTITTKAIPRSPDRNLIKRRLREIFRHHKHLFRVPCDVIVIAKQGAHTQTIALLQNQFITALTKSGFMKQGTP